MTELPPLRTIGQPARRTDAHDKVTGRSVYSVDIDLPGMLHAKVMRGWCPSTPAPPARCPVFMPC